LDRALDEDEALAVRVLPDRVWWMVNSWPGAAWLRSFLIQTAEYAEIYGAPIGRVWQRGFWYRPIASEAEAIARGEAVARMPWDQGLVARFGRWPAGVCSAALG
jgi:hypothetical protein